MSDDSVKLIECPRDAWQGLKKQIPTELKVHYLRALIGAGFKHIDAASFDSPKAVPQMMDSEQVLERLDPPNDVEIIGIVVNEKGAERAIATEAVATLGYPYSISDTFLRKNQNQSPEENYQVLETIKKRADDAQLGMVVYISMAFGNPYGDPWSEDEVRKAVENIVDIDIRSISLADTVGAATPELISRVVRAVTSDWRAAAPSSGTGRNAPGERRSVIDIGIHMHSTRSDAVARVLAAYDAGCRRFDSAIGGLGGCPFAQDTLIGNIPTESVIEALQQRRVDLPIRKSIASLMAMNVEISTKFSS
jgi:hydroxymethylglutaryl-CoA lyase